MPGRLWTKEQDEILMARYKIDGPSSQALQQLLGRTRQSIVHRAMFLGLSEEAFTPWTKEDDAILREEYPKGHHAELAARLHRSECAINVRASRIGVQVSHDSFVRNVSEGKGFGDNNSRFKGSGRVSGMFMSALKERRICTVTASYLDSLAVDICPFSGYPLVYRVHRKVKNATASLDRIDSSKGYIEGNVRWIHKDVNIAKWSMTDEEFLSWINKIYRHCKGKKEVPPGILGTQSVYCPPKHGGNRFQGYGRITGTYLGKVRAGAKSRGLDHPLLLDSCGIRYLDSIIPEVCPFSGEPLTFPSRSSERFTSASLDRIDSRLGYVLGNVRWVHRAINLMKTDKSDEQFLTLVNDIATHCLL